MMSIKNKKHQPLSNTLYDLAQQAGLLLMTAAVTVGMLELPEHPNSRIILPSQPSFIQATETTEQNNPIRREREESAPHYISYSVVQRTPARSGKH